MTNVQSDFCLYGCSGNSNILVILAIHGCHLLILQFYSIEVLQYHHLSVDYIHFTLKMILYFRKISPISLSSFTFHSDSIRHSFRDLDILLVVVNKEQQVSLYFYQYLVGATIFSFLHSIFQSCEVVKYVTVILVAKRTNELYVHFEAWSGGICTLRLVPKLKG